MPYLAACRSFCLFSTRDVNKKKKIGQEYKQFHLDHFSCLIYELFILYELLRAHLYKPFVRIEYTHAHFYIC